LIGIISKVGTMRYLFLSFMAYSRCLWHSSGVGLKAKLVHVVESDHGENNTGSHTDSMNEGGCAERSKQRQSNFREQSSLGTFSKYDHLQITDALEKKEYLVNIWNKETASVVQLVRTLSMMRVIMSSSAEWSNIFLFFTSPNPCYVIIEVWLSGSKPNIIRRTALVQQFKERTPGHNFAQTRNY